MYVYVLFACILACSRVSMYRHSSLIMEVFLSYSTPYSLRKGLSFKPRVYYCG